MWSVFDFSSVQYIYTAILEAVACWYLRWSDDAGDAFYLHL